MRLNPSILSAAAAGVVSLQTQAVIADNSLLPLPPDTIHQPLDNNIINPEFVFFAVGSLLTRQELAAGSADGPSPHESGLAPDVRIPDGAILSSSSLSPSSPRDYVELLERHVHSRARRKQSAPAAHYHRDLRGGAAARDLIPGSVHTTAAVRTKRAAKDFFLRIMPLGASITQGFGSTDGTGYRKLLRSRLRFAGWKVNMVGSKRDGGMADSDNEGHPGKVIAEVREAFDGSGSSLMPNLVLINAGTNDCIRKLDPAGAGERLRALVDDIFSSIPGVTVVVSTLSPHRDDPACAASVSQQYRDLVGSAAYRDARIGLADLHAAISAEQHLTADGIHPNDEGYRVFAAVWYEAISKLEDRIQPAPATDNAGLPIPLDDDIGNTRTCPKVKGVARGPVASQKGSGKDDGIYVHDRVERGVLESGRVEKFDGESAEEVPGRVYFANLVVLNGRFERGEELDDLVRVRFEGDGDEGRWYLRQNLGEGRFGELVEFDVGMNCGRGNLFAFGDFNNDGLDDFFCIKPNYAIAVSLNRGDRTVDGGRVPIFESIGDVSPAHAGFEAADVRIADIDGDGRADYCLIDPESNIACSRNGGQGDDFIWQGFRSADGLRDVVFDKKPGINKACIFLGDINGDFRSDYLHIGDTGAIETFINSRGTIDTSPGIVPDWRDAGLTHPGLPVLGDVRDRIKLGRVFGSGRLDYVYLKESSRHFDVVAWENKGSGGRLRKSDGDFYCDMRGTGSDDYVWISEDGREAELYANIRSPPEWGHDVKIDLANVAGHPRAGMHLGDWNGDGRCDVLVQDKKTGALRLFENQFVAGGSVVSFLDRGVVTGSLSVCTEGWGVSSVFDRGMRLADIDGDGRVDILCLEQDGRITGWLNRAGALEDVGQVKFSEGWDRANIRFADVEASGRADLIHLDKYTGEARVFKNDGYKGVGRAGGGSSVAWSDRGVLFSGVDRGANIHFSNQGGLGRADLVRVLPDNQAFTYFNECSGGAGCDDGPIVDPGLPTISV